MADILKGEKKKATQRRPPTPGPGRPPGKRNKATEIAQQLLDDQGERITQKCIDLALGGADANPKVQGIAIKLCMERLIPPRKIFEIEGEGLKSLNDEQLKLRLIELLGPLAVNRGSGDR